MSNYYHKRQITYDEAEYLVKYTYDPGHPAVHYYPDGSGDPGAAPGVEIASIIGVNSGLQYIELLTPFQLDQVAEIILSLHEE